MNVLRFALMIVVVVVCMAGQLACASDLVVPRAVIPFSGILDLKSPKVVITFGIEKPAGSGAVVVEIARPAAGRYDLTADIRHVTTLLGDAAAVLNGRFELVGPDLDRRELRGEVSTQYTLLNYKPVCDVHIKFAVRDRQLMVDPLWFGALSGRGQIDLMGQHDVDISLDLLSADLDELLFILRGQGMKTWPFSGIITGSLILQGPWAKPVVSAHLSAYRGQWKDFGYEMIDVRFGGTYPLLRLTEGKVVSSDGPSFSVSGIFDLADPGRLEAQIRQLKQELIIDDDGSGNARAFRFNVSDGHSTRLKAFLSGDADGRNQGEQVIGIEKRIGF